MMGAIGWGVAVVLAVIGGLFVCGAALVYCRHRAFMRSLDSMRAEHERIMREIHAGRPGIPAAPPGPPLRRARWL